MSASLVGGTDGEEEAGTNSHTPLRDLEKAALIIAGHAAQEFQLLVTSGAIAGSICRQIHAFQSSYSRSVPPLKSSRKPLSVSRHSYEIRAFVESVQPYMGAKVTDGESVWNLSCTLLVVNDWAKIDRHRSKEHPEFAALSSRCCRSRKTDTARLTVLQAASNRISGVSFS